MINITTILKAADNSGVRYLSCIGIPNEAFRLGAFPGMVIKCSVKKVLIKQNLKKSRILKQGQLCNALLVRTVFGFKRWGNFYFKAATNAVIIINKHLLPIGTRLFGPVFREIRSKKFFKIIAKSEVAL